jgi:hypothetical protein
LSVTEKLERIYAELPDVPCTGQCHTSCSYIGMSEAEYRRIKRETGIEIEMYQSPCPALDFAGRCSIHDLRPLICRLYGATERLRCPWGCKPERWLSDSEVSDAGQAHPGHRRAAQRGGDGLRRGGAESSRPDARRTKVNRLKWFIHDQKVLAEKRLLRAWDKVPRGIRQTLVLNELGRLSVTDPRLHSREVPTITVQEIIDAMKFEEAAA